MSVESFRVSSILPVLAGLSVFVAAFFYRLLDATKLVNDHFMHVVWGRQLLMGRSLVDDMVTLGMPLQIALSAWAEWFIGYRRLSEAIVVAAAFATGAVLTFHLGRRISGSTAIAFCAAALQILITPRGYSYPKILTYALGILVLWRYVDRPSPGRAAQVGATVAFAFYLRHDHGIYLGLVASTVLLIRHWGDWKAIVRPAVVGGAICLGCIAPYLTYVQATYGILPWAENLRQFAAREFQGDPYVWPAWPLRSIDGLIRRLSEEDRGARVNIRWTPGSSEDDRRATAARHGLRVVSGGAVVESGTFVLRDLSRDNVLNLLRNPFVEDTAGIDRATGEIRLRGIRLGSIRLLSDLDSDNASAALLFFVVLAVTLATLVALAIQNRGASAGHELQTQKVVVLLLMTVTGMLALVRDPLPVRIGDAAVAPVVLGAWLTARWLRRGTFWSPPGIGRVLMAVTLLAVVARAVIVVGAVPARVERVRSDALLWKRLTTSPPFDAWQAVGSAEYQIVRYVRTCTAPREPLLVLWFAPEFYYFADRPFAGRYGFYIKGYWNLEHERRRNIEALQRDRPALAIIEAGRERIDLPSHPEVLRYFTEFYQQVGELPSADGTVLQVFARRDRVPASIDAESGWPCYQPAPVLPSTTG